MRLKHLTRAAVIAGAVALPLAGAVPAQAAPTSSAFGIKATGPVPVPATPSATYNGKNAVSKNVVEVPSNPLLEAKVLHAMAGKAHAKASVNNVSIPQAKLTAKLIAAKCVKGKPTSHLVKARMAGKPLAAKAKPNTDLTVDLGPLGDAKVVLNKQVRTADGVTVTAIELSLPLGPGKTETISIASATCGAKGGGGSDPGPGDPSPTPTATTPDGPGATTPPGQAPVPTPVPGNLPVTG